MKKDKHIETITNMVNEVIECPDSQVLYGIEMDFIKEVLAYRGRELKNKGEDPLVITIRDYISECKKKDNVSFFDIDKVALMYNMFKHINRVRYEDDTN